VDFIDFSPGAFTSQIDVLLAWAVGRRDFGRGERDRRHDHQVVVAQHAVVRVAQ
jgi:hypothetical protein